MKEQIVERDAQGRMIGMISRELSPLEAYAVGQVEAIKAAFATFDGAEAVITVDAGGFDPDLLRKEILKRLEAQSAGRPETAAWTVQRFSLSVQPAARAERAGPAAAPRRRPLTLREAADHEVAAEIFYAVIERDSHHPASHVPGGSAVYAPAPLPHDYPLDVAVIAERVKEKAEADPALWQRTGWARLEVQLTKHRAEAPA